MDTFLAAIIVLAIAIAAMCIGIIVKGRFPETEVSRNEDMRKLGIKCVKEDEESLSGGRQGRRKSSACSAVFSDACIGCGLFPGNRVGNAEK